MGELARIKSFMLGGGGSVCMAGGLVPCGWLKISMGRFDRTDISGSGEPLQMRLALITRTGPTASPGDRAGRSSGAVVPACTAPNRGDGAALYGPLVGH
jgi:hypothetical protein